MGDLENNIIPVLRLDYQPAWGVLHIVSLCLKAICFKGGVVVSIIDDWKHFCMPSTRLEYDRGRGRVFLWFVIQVFPSKIKAIQR